MREPVLLLVGDRDEFVPGAEALALHRAVGFSQLAVLPDADHGLPERRPDDFARTVRAFTQTLRAAAPVGPPIV